MRLIDADALNDVLIQKQYNAQSMGILYTEYPNMMGIVAKQPTIEAAPVAHGQCKFCEDYDKFSEIVCYLPTDNGDAIIVPLNYCPNCGERMDGDGDA